MTNDNESPIAAATDAFTERHLRQYADAYVHGDEYDAFMAYATEMLTRHPELANDGWDRLLDSFRESFDGASAEDVHDTFSREDAAYTEAHEHGDHVPYPHEDCLLCAAEQRKHP
jgi:hypothetical protein